MAKLLVQETAGVREFELIDKEVSIGRELDNSLRLSDPSISRHHAVLKRTEGGWEVHDLQSSNGVLLNGARVTATASLKDGDGLILGQMRLTFSDPASVSANDPATAETPLGTVRMNQADIARLQGRQEADTRPSQPDSLTGAVPVPDGPGEPPRSAVPDAPSGGFMGWLRGLFGR